MKNEERNTEWWDYDGRLFNFRPCLFVFLFLCLGILYGFLVVYYNAPLWWLLFLLPIIPLPYLIVRKKSAWYAVWVMALAFLCGGLSYYAKATDYLASPIVNGDRMVYGEVLSVEYTEGQTELVLTDLHIAGVEYEGKLIAYLLGGYGENIRVGDRVYMEGKVTTALDLYGEGAQYSFAEDIRYRLISSGRAQTVSHSVRLFATIRETLKERLYEGMGEDSASLAFAILTGDASFVEEGLLENTRRGGIAHIFAVSGLHIGTLYGLCILLFSKINALKGKRLLRLVVVFFVLVFYGGICGFRESVIRAVVGCIVAETCLLLGFKRDMLETLSIAGIAVLAVNPISIFCVGFQLSFLACFGIAFLARPIQVRLERIFIREDKAPLLDRILSLPPDPVGKRENKVIPFLSITISAQLATAPVLYITFGYLSIWGLLLNCLLVPCIGWVFSCTLLFSSIACVLPTALSKLILWLPNLVWTVIALIFQIFDFTNVFIGNALPFGAVLAYYCALIAFSDKLNLSKRKRRIGVGVFLACFLIGYFL